MSTRMSLLIFRSSASTSEMYSRIENACFDHLACLSARTLCVLQPTAFTPHVAVGTPDLYNQDGELLSSSNSVMDASCIGQLILVL